MVISIVTRKTSIKDRAQWQSRLEAALPAILAVLKAERGFAGVEYLWGAQDDGQGWRCTRTARSPRPPPRTAPGCVARSRWWTRARSAAAAAGPTRRRRR